jgi:hypothetical protein
MGVSEEEMMDNSLIGSILCGSVEGGAVTTLLEAAGVGERRGRRSGMESLSIANPEESEGELVTCWYFSPDFL